MERDCADDYHVPGLRRVSFRAHRTAVRARRSPARRRDPGAGRRRIPRTERVWLPAQGAQSRPHARALELSETGDRLSALARGRTGLSRASPPELPLRLNAPRLISAPVLRREATDKPVRAMP